MPKLFEYSNFDLREAQGARMSVVWKCAFPECAAMSSEHKDWMRMEEIERWMWLFFAFPIFGNVFACRNFADNIACHYCQKHAEFLRGKDGTK